MAVLEHALLETSYLFILLNFTKLNEINILDLYSQ